MLTAAILVWAAVYVVVRRRREAAASQAFQSDPMDAEIGREALRRVFGILADEDPAPLNPAITPTASMADRTTAPTALGPLVAVPLEATVAASAV
ncbi:MAG: hypothetical protein ACRDGQ_13685, partial [Candidatus Limnocylindrales bacterium]